MALFYGSPYPVRVQLHAFLYRIIVHAEIHAATLVIAFVFICKCLDSSVVRSQGAHSCHYDVDIYFIVQRLQLLSTALFRLTLI